MSFLCFFFSVDSCSLYLVCLTFNFVLFSIVRIVHMDMPFLRIKSVASQCLIYIPATAYLVYLNEQLFLWYRAHTVFVWFDLYLIGGKVNIQAGIFHVWLYKTEKNEWDEKSFGTYFALVLPLCNLGSLSNSSWNVLDTDASLANLSRVVDRWDPQLSCDKATGEAVARAPTAPSTE